MKRSQLAILIVEDEPGDQLLIEESFRAAGVTGFIHTADDGEAAIAYLMGEGEFADRAKYPYPSLILTDLKMAKGDGFAVLQHIKSNPDWAIIPTVVLSASDDPDDIRTAYELGASCYHVKPTGYEQLKHQLKMLHDYWLTCDVPEIDAAGRRVSTERAGKLGERFAQLPPLKQSRVRRNAPP